MTTLVPVQVVQGCGKTGSGKTISAHDTWSIPAVGNPILFVAAHELEDAVPYTPPGFSLLMDSGLAKKSIPRVVVYAKVADGDEEFLPFDWSLAGQYVELAIELDAQQVSSSLLLAMTTANAEKNVKDLSFELLTEVCAFGVLCAASNCRESEQIPATATGGFVLLWAVGAGGDDHLSLEVFLSDACVDSPGTYETIVTWSKNAHRAAVLLTAPVAES
jgi:hypothetical protein